MNSARVFVDMAPELILLLGGCCTLMVGLGRRPRALIVNGTALLTLVAALWVTLQLGDSRDAAPALGLMLTPVTYFTRWLTLGMGILVLLVNWHQPVNEERGEYLAMILFSLLGVLLTASANDLLVLFFAVELVSIPTYVLIGLSRLDQRASESTVKYFFLGALAAALLAYGLSFLYGAAGTTSIYVVRDGVLVSTLGSGLTIGAIGAIGLAVVFAGMCFKIAAVPFHVYAPDVYEGAAAPVTGMLGFVPKFAGFLALIKISAALEWSLPREWMWIIWVVAAATMTVGNVLALLQSNIKRMLAYSSIAHTGYMLIGLLVGPIAGRGPLHDGVAAMLFYIAVYGAMNLGVFALLASLRVGDREVETLDDLAGSASRAPGMTLALAVCVFSLMGLPPTAGFLGKLYIFSSAFSLDAGHPFQGPLAALAIIGVLNSAIGAAYYLRIVATAYMGRELEPVSRAGGTPVRLALVLCALGMLVLFARPSPLAREARHTAAATLPLNAADGGKIALLP